MSENEGAVVDEYAPIQSFWCRALYDYTAQDASALSFRRGDIIEVLSQQRSGWWDGLLGDERGWFPSNYVERISDEEAEAAFSGSEFDPSVQEDAPSTSVQSTTSFPQTISETTTEDSSVVDMSSAMLSSIQSENEDWLNSELGGSGGINALANATMDSEPTQVHDFWMPEVTDGGQIYYVNTQTGERSSEIPREAGSEPSDDLVGLTSQSSSRSGTSAGLGYASDSSQSSNDFPGFGVQRSTGTPEPWIRKLADDGYSYFYLNKMTKDVQWTRPEGGPTTTNGGTPIPSSTSQSQLNRMSIYSDSSDINPFDVPGTQKRHVNGHSHQVHSESELPPPFQTTASELTAAERIAQSLQKELEASPQDSITDLSALARNSIQAIVNNVHSKNRRNDDGDKMDQLISSVVDAVRNLLYVSAAPTGQIPSNVIPRDARSSASQPAPQLPLKPAQRKVTATLSRLVLSARAMQYDAGSIVSDTLNRIEVDAEELERAIMSFVLEVQRLQHTSPSDQAPKIKRLQGIFSLSNVGLGLVGSGAAGSWTGFGFAPVDDEQLPQRVLGQDVVSELASYLQQLEGMFSALGRHIQSNADTPVEEIQSQGQVLVTQISAFLTFVSNIHVAKHVDVDGIRQGSNQVSEDLYSRYAHTVDRARLLVRTLEAAVQSLYDDGASFFLAIQGLRDLEPGQSRHDRDAVYDHVDGLSTALKSNMAVVQQTLDALLSTGHEQADLAHGDYRGSIDYRLSRLSAIRPSSAILAADGSELVDMSGALLDRPGPRKNIDRAELYSSDGQHSTSSLDNAPSGENGMEPDGFDDDSDEEPSTKKPGRRKDLGQIFGADAALPPAPAPPPPAVDAVPWYLKPDYDPKEILVDPDFSVRGGTVPAMVERLTAHEHQDSNYLAFQRSFLMTFKSFTTVDELFDLLVARFWIQPPPKLTPPEREKWANLKQRVIQARVLNTFKSLITDEDVLDKEDMHILDRIKEFTQQEEVIRFTGAKTLLPLIDRVQRGDPTQVRRVVLGTPPPPIMPKPGKKLKLLDIEPLEMARQLTIMESRLYQKIRPMECLQRAREQKTENMDNIAIVIQTSNRIADWVAESILTKEDSRRRAAAVKHLISIADRCRTMNNFSTMIAITSGLNTPPIRRLKRTWEQVNQKVMAQFGACEMTIDSSKNFHKYRQLMATVNPPCVPFIGVFLSTLQFIHDGNADNLPGDLVNFKKRQKASEVISDIQRWQQTSFNFQAIPSVQTFIEESLSQFQDTKASSDHFWALSLEREPREREDEKMARLLQESGFL